MHMYMYVCNTVSYMYVAMLCAHTLTGTTNYNTKSEHM